jgi:hypothetical protein
MRHRFRRSAVRDERLGKAESEQLVFRMSGNERLKVF